ncbi:SRPBCC family protein [Sphingomonas baiyangensis]|nr:SRPBCC family protein [Sphingomonas baiyangensis]
MRTILMAAAMSIGAPAAAEVTSAALSSFVIDAAITVDAPPARVWDSFRAPASWWDAEHSYSGDAANLYMDAQATGCFCERIPDGKGSIEHAHIVYVAPGRMVRMTGGLGPLQAEAVAATLTFRFDAEGEGATKVTMRYVVGGHMQAGGETMAPLVDNVLLHQLARLKAAAERAAPGS